MIEFYGKCYDIKTARQLKKAAPTGSVECWESLIEILGYCGIGDRSFEQFQRMLKQGCQPKAKTFAIVMNSCGINGYANEVGSLFSLMKSKYNITPSIPHYTSLIDALCRVNRLNTAQSYLQSLQNYAHKSSQTLPALLSILKGCQKYNNYAQGMQIGEKIQQLKLSTPETQRILGNISLQHGEQQKATRYYNEAFRLGKQQKREVTWTSNNAEIFEFRSEDSSEESESLYKSNWKELDTLIQLGLQFQKHLDHFSEEDKKKFLLSHSECYALRFAHEQQQTNALRITKDTPISADVHAWLLGVSKLWKQEILARDSVRLHHIKDGTCSCPYHW